MNELLYHYATGAGLLGMLKDYTKDEPNIKLWASHYMYMNDPQEYEMGKRICTDIINKVEIDLGISDEYRIKKIVESPFYCSLIGDYFRTSQGQLISPYLISLSSAFDSLHMWDMYASNGNGLALGFNRVKLLENNVHLKDCIYYKEDDERIESQLKDEIRDIYNELNKENPLTSSIQESMKNGEYVPLYLRIHYIYTLICLLIGIRIKSEAYDLEKEVRITPRAKDVAKILFRDLLDELN